MKKQVREKPIEILVNWSKVAEKARVAKVTVWRWRKQKATRRETNRAVTKALLNELGRNKSIITKKSELP